jgi:ketosteroid isomerase-like protein
MTTAHPNAQSLQDAYEGFATGDLEPLLDLLTDDVEWVDSTVGPLAGTYRGRGGVERFFAAMASIWGETLRVEVVDIIAESTHGIVLTSESGATGSNQADWTSVHVWTFDASNRCTRFVNYSSAGYQRLWSDAARAESRPQTP